METPKTNSLKPLKTLAQFKQELGVQKIDFVKGKGHAFANVKDKTLIIGSSTDLTQPLYVIELSVNKDGEAIEPNKSFVIINSEVKEFATV